MKKDFEAGKFYAVSLYPVYGNATARYIAAMCFRKLKRKIEFKYISKRGGNYEKVIVSRSYTPASENVAARAYVNERYSMIPITFADMEVSKPARWDEVEG